MHDSLAPQSRLFMAPYSYEREELVAVKLSLLLSFSLSCHIPRGNASNDKVSSNDFDWRPLAVPPQKTVPGSEVNILVNVKQTSQQVVNAYNSFS